MSTKEARANDATGTASVAPIDLKLEVVIIPVSDVNRSKQFYGSLGWRLDADFAMGDAFRIVQFTPPGSGCSIGFGQGVTTAAPGSARGLELITSEIEAARAELVSRGVDVSEVFHGSPFSPAGRISGPDPEHASYKSYAAFEDPDGNLWLLQEVTVRLPGRIDSAETAFVSAADLAGAMRRASVAHGEHEKRTGVADENWPDWYAEYMVREQTGEALPQRPRRHERQAATGRPDRGRDRRQRRHRARDGRSRARAGSRRDHHGTRSGPPAPRRPRARCQHRRFRRHGLRPAGQVLRRARPRRSTTCWSRARARTTRRCRSSTTKRHVATSRPISCCRYRSLATPGGRSAPAARCSS